MSYALKNNFNPKLLLLDDEPNTLRALQRLLFDEDFLIFSATNGEDALRILSENNDISVIISDQKMPEMSGTEFLKQAREIAPHSFRILLTAYADISIAMESINQSGVFRLLTKPWDEELLLNSIHEAMHCYRVMCENDYLHDLIKEQNEELKIWNNNLVLEAKNVKGQLKEVNTELDQLHKTLSKTVSGSVEILSTLLDLRDQSITHHANHVSALARLIAKNAELSLRDIVTIKIAGLLHDIGKIGISDVALHKNEEQLTEEEFEEYTKHPARGQRIVESIDQLADVGALIRSHHESYNGTGFPDKLAKTKIPLGSRIIGIADYIENTIWGFKPDKAIGLISDNLKAKSGSFFDPGLIQPAVKAAKEYYTPELLLDNCHTKIIKISQLQCGMILAQDLITKSSMLLLPRGVCLEENHIRCIRHYAETDDSCRNIAVIHSKQESAS